MHVLVLQQMSEVSDVQENNGKVYVMHASHCVSVCI